MHCRCCKFLVTGAQMPPNVRRPLFDGMQMVHGLWFDLALIGEPEARRRVLRHWAPGARLYLAQGGFLLLLALPRYGHCATLDGLALCQQSGILSSAPLAPDECAATLTASIWLIRAAQVQQISLAALPCIDPALWLELDAISLHVPLQPPRATGATATTGAAGAAAPLAATPVREIFSGTIPAPSPRCEAFLKQLEQEQRDASHARPGGAAGLAAAAAQNLVGATAVALLAIPLLLLKWLGGVGKSTGQQTPASSARPHKQPAQPSALAQRWSALAERLAILTRVSKMVGWRQAAYLRKMIDLLEQGDIQDALRHAIPLNTPGQHRQQSFGAPRPRTSLLITRMQAASSTIGIAPDLDNYLRTKYRSTFERLDREGKIDEATFVLAELLKCGSEAVDYLERKGRIRQAAQLAETMELAPAIAVRLWCLEGNIERALQLAQLGQAFASALQLLERRQSPQAATLRLLWAEDLAWRGQLSEAAEVIWPLADLRERALAWLQEAERAAGTLGLRALIKKLTLQPDSLADSEPRLRQLLEDASEQGAQQRASLARELLVQAQHSSATRRVVAELVRPLLADRMAGHNRLDKKSLTQLVKISADALLKADLPQLSMPELTSVPQALRARTQILQVHLTERGLLPLHDVRCLPDGHYLLALGEAGVVCIDRRGRQLRQFPVPATRLVMAAGGQRALALVQRDGMWRVSRIDLLAGKVTDWIVQPLQFWADDYDGLLWSAVIDQRLVAIDTSKDQLAVSWQVADLPGRIVAFQEEWGMQTLLLSSPGEIQQWRYQLAGRRLTQRDSFPHPQESVWQLLPDSARDAPTMLQLPFKAPFSSLQIYSGNLNGPLDIPLGRDEQPPEVSLCQGLLLVRSYPEGKTLRCLVVDVRTGRALAELSLAEGESVRACLDNNHILLFDQAGRLIDINVEDGQVHTWTLA
jgi:hypothetical protein